MLGPVPQATTQVAALTSIGPVNTGVSPIGMAIDPASGHIYVTNSGSNTVSVIDPLTSAVIDVVPTGLQPGEIIINSKTQRAYVSNFADKTLNVIDLVSNKPLRTLPVGGLGLALDSAAQRLYGRALRSSTQPTTSSSRPCAPPPPPTSGASQSTH